MQHVQDDLRPVLAAERLLAALTDKQTVTDHDDARGTALHAPSGKVDIEGVARHLGIGLARLSPTLRPDTLGYLEPGENLIFLRVDLPRPVWRFTLAHEIGHAALHRAWGDAAALARGQSLTDASIAPVGPATNVELRELQSECAGGDFAAPLDVANGQDELLRPGQAYSAAARREQEANLFAAALLLPADVLLRAYFALTETTGSNDVGGRTTADRTQRLARVFGVSEDVLLRRLTALLASLPGERRARYDAQAGAMPAAVTGQGAPMPTLDRAQRLAVEAQTPALVIAGPGAGKTSALLGRILYLITERHVPPSSILALTFSNKAARELQMRLGSALAERERQGAQPENSPTVNTLHGFCGEVLRRFGALVGVRANYRLVSEVEGFFLLRQSARDLPLTYYHPLAAPTQYYPDLLAAISRAKDELADPARYHEVTQEMIAKAETPEARLAAERAHEVALVYAAYQKALEARGDPDFGDIIRLTVRLFQEYPDVLTELRGQYDALLVDEFQDINYAMAVLLRLMAGADGPLWAVGDADQAIYRFRGAAPDTLARFADDYPGANILTLPYNYRSLPPIVEAASAVGDVFLSSARPRIGDDRLLISTRQDSQHATSAALPRPCVTLASAPDDTAELAGLTEDIRLRIAGGRSPSEIAILCRTHRQAAQVISALRHAAIPTLAPAPLFEQSIVKDVLVTLSLLIDQSGAGLLRAGDAPDHAFTRAEAVALLRAARCRQITPLALLRSRAQVRALDNVSPDGLRGFERLRATLTALRRAPNVMTGMARYAFSLTGLGARLLGQVEAGADLDAAQRQYDAARGTLKAARQRAASLERLLALAHAYDEQRLSEALANNLPAPKVADWAGFLDYIRALITLRQRLGAGDDQHDETSDEAVRVLTVHESKGLEFPVVYLPGLANRRFPSALQHERAPAPSGLSANLANASAETREATHLLEEACLFYVALTRARDALILSYARRYGRAVYHPSPFIAPIERQLGPRLTRIVWHTPGRIAPVAAALEETISEAERTPDDSAMLLAQRRGDRESRDGEQASVASLETGEVSIAALESALRCPRQYAYRAVYGFGERQAGLSALRHGVQQTLSGLHSRFATAQEASPQTAPRPLNGRSQRTNPAPEGEQRADGGWSSSFASMREQPTATLTLPTEGPLASSTPPTLDDARSLFDHHWALALNGAESQKQSAPGALSTVPVEQSGAPGADVTHAIYQRHGRQIAERLWREAMRQHGLWDALPTADSDRQDVGLPGAGLHPGAAQTISVQVGNRTIHGVLDHVELGAASEKNHGSVNQDANGQANQRSPIRVAYYRTSGDDEPTLHDLFYTLAARQLAADLEREGRPTQVEAIRYSLATGEAQPIVLSMRQRERLERSLDEAFATLDRGVYPAKPEPRRCQHCPFLLVCPA